MEAYHLYKTGFDRNLTKNDIEILAANSLDFYSVDSYIESLEKYFKPAAECISGITMTATEMVAFIKGRGGPNLSANQLGMRLVKMGYECTRQDKAGTRKYRIEERQ